MFPDNSMILVQENAIKANNMPSFTGKSRLRAGLDGKVIGDEVRAYLDDYYPDFTNLVMDLISCENFELIENKCGDSGMSCGILQIQEQTFKNWNCQGEWKNSEDQIDCAIPAIKSGIGSTLGGWYNCWRIKNLFKYGY